MSTLFFPLNKAYSLIAPDINPLPDNIYGPGGLPYPREGSPAPGHKKTRAWAQAVIQS